MAGLSSLIPLLILFIVVGIGAYIGYGIYQWSNELGERANKKMEKKHMSFTKDGGLRVGVKEQSNENYTDKTQNVLVNVWNHTSFPNYKSRLGWNNTQADDSKADPGKAS
ncbi:hypothetical protein KC332_g15380 [Hortaea werneckii]|uniref:Uncharacterized protein n=2 Tax=Hortaea werneckii TaxID=91943 RepID=A0A3M7I8S7_HORWE|nr:hypothetical protein KC358_g15287 [Hortaea werneckii]OTA24171.1 hypothetical protein BTJ68_11675 [Hortaea werneckii EXF-2000]KAI6814789.1 hypothetical protein KC350_g11201 [Hortaea werneckii]KAI6904028.1 hypothetical protein KC348_g15475 [Hortaea werneckii]KAI6922480.1 hypothetical protein KC341_g15376 [Hortaea werneckii]